MLLRQKIGERVDIFLDSLPGRDHLISNSIISASNKAFAPFFMCGINFKKDFVMQRVNRLPRSFLKSTFYMWLKTILNSLEHKI